MELHRGVARRIDHLGRIVVPVELRRMFDIAAGDELEVGTDGTCITLTKVQTRCVFCGTERGLHAYRDKQVCRPCASEVGENSRSDRGPGQAADSGLSL